MLVESDLGHTTLCRVIRVTNATFTNTLLNYNRMVIVVLDQHHKKKLKKKLNCCIRLVRRNTHMVLCALRMSKSEINFVLVTWNRKLALILVALFTMSH